MNSPDNPSPTSQPPAPANQTVKASNRRSLLAAATACGLTSPARAVSASTGPSHQEDSKRLENPIVRENRQSGTLDWKIDKIRIEPTSKYRSPWIEGYASHASIRAGETLQIMISTSAPTTVQVDLFRLGYYAGLGGRRVGTYRDLPCKPQPLPSVGENRLMFCDWAPALEFAIPESWTSGVYLAKLTEGIEGLQSYVIFIVRDERRSDLTFQCSDHTWQAYNRWPSQFSLYDDGDNVWHWGNASRVSFARPYGKYCQILDAPLSLGSGEFFLWEFPFAYWLEEQGYDVQYVSNTDTNRDPETAQRSRGFLSVGHDEYWTIEMFRHVQTAVESGTSVGFFSGNAVCGRVEWDEPTRSFRRTGVFGPPGGTREFHQMSNLKHERPYANELIGAHSTGPVTGGADWVCSAPQHWIYAGTGMQLGDRIPGLIGWEYHGDPAPIPGLEIVATGPTQSAPGVLNGGTYTATMYPGPKGNFVFNASTCWWADGLSAPPGYQSPSVYTSPKGVDHRVQRITRNILDRMIRPT